MAKLDKQGNLTLAPHEVLQLRGLAYQYGQLVRKWGPTDSAPILLLRQIRCMLPIPEEGD